MTPLVLDILLVLFYGTPRYLGFVHALEQRGCVVEDTYWVSCPIKIEE